MYEKEYCIANRESYVLNLVLSMGIVKQIKEKLFSLHSESIDILGLAKNTIIDLFPKQSFHFPEFVEWCAQNYSQSERVIMNKDG